MDEKLLGTAMVNGEKYRIYHRDVWDSIQEADKFKKFIKIRGKKYNLHHEFFGHIKIPDKDAKYVNINGKKYSLYFKVYDNKKEADKEVAYMRKLGMKVIMDKTSSKYYIWKTGVDTKIWWKRDLTKPIRGFVYNDMPNGYEKGKIAVVVNELGTTRTNKTIKVELEGNVIVKKDDYKRIPGAKKVVTLNSKTTKAQWAKTVKDFYQNSQKKYQK
jgi:hypothetical protein